MSSSLMHQVKHRRDRVPTTIYNDNYGYTINFYQPMIDYLDAKRRGDHPQYPHLPWSNERALPKYSDRKKISNYTKPELKTYSTEVYESAKIRDRDLDNYKVIKRASPISVTKSALGARLNKHIHLPTIEEKLIRKQEEREAKRRVANIMDDIEHIKARFNADRDVKISAGLKSSIRGKTASQITAALLNESRKNINESKNEEQIEISRATNRRGCSENRIIQRTTHIEFMDDHMLDQLDKSMTTSLSDVKKQLNSFNQRTEDLYHNSRLRKRYF